MSFRSIMLETLPPMFRKFGESAAFTPQGGATIEDCHVFLEFDVQYEPDGFDATAWQGGTVIEAFLSEIGRVPGRGDEFAVAVDGATKNFTVKKILKNDGVIIKAAVIEHG